MSEELGMKNKKSNFGEWYLEVLEKAEIVDMRYGVKGFTIYLPLGMLAIREIYNFFHDALEDKNHQPVLFPVVIPKSALSKEAEHIKGFEHEVFWITKGGKEKLEEELCLRPTSETAFYPMYSIWIRSHQQLPLKLYQSVSMYRHETKMTKPLMRGREFLWIETHTAQKNWEDAEKQVKEDIEIFKRVMQSLAIPFVVLRRPDWDKFPGAEHTYAFETILPDGKSLQIGTTHNLGEKFAKVFKIQYTDENGKKKYVNQTCFGPGISRILGALVSMHGDDKGMIFPPSIAPIQIVITPIYTGITRAKVMEKCGEILGILEKKFRIHLDDREQYTPGFKFHEWELKGVPLRIEIGPKDIDEKKVSIVRRDFLERTSVDEDKLEEQILEILDSIGFQLNKKAQEKMIINDANDYKEIKEKLKEGGFIRIYFCMQEKCAEKLKKETTTEVRGTLALANNKPKEKCAICGNKAKEVVYIAKAY
jgi:prolyl-tRNA synthetase